MGNTETKPRVQGTVEDSFKSCSFILGQNLADRILFFENFNKKLTKSVSEPAVPWIMVNEKVINKVGFDLIF